MLLLFMSTRTQMPDLGLRCAKTAAVYAKSEPREFMESLMELQLKLALDAESYDDAYHALLVMLSHAPDSHCREAVQLFVDKLWSNAELKRLCSYTYGGSPHIMRALQNEFEKRAVYADVYCDAASATFFDFLYAFHLTRGDYKQGINAF